MNVTEEGARASGPLSNSNSNTSVSTPDPVPQVGESSLTNPKHVYLRFLDGAKCYLSGHCQWVWIVFIAITFTLFLFQSDSADCNEVGAQPKPPSPVKPQHQDLVYKGPFVGRARVTKDYTPSPYDKESLTLKVTLKLGISDFFQEETLSLCHFANLWNAC